MGTFNVRVGGQLRSFPIAGETPTPDERENIRAELVSSQKTGTSSNAKLQVGQFQAPAPEAAPEQSFASKLIPRNVSDLQPAVVGGAATAGSLVGGAAGLTSGPLAVPGAITGGLLGAAGGQGIFELLVEAGRVTGAVGPEGILADDPTVGFGRGGALGPTNRMLTEGAIESLIPGMIPVGRTAKNLIKRNLAGVGNSGMRLAMKAERLGIPVTVENITNRTSLKTFRKIVGIFPFLGTPFKKADRRAAAAVAGKLEEMLSEFSPSTILVTQAGVDMSDKAMRRTKAVSRVFSRAYEKMLTEAHEAGAVIRPQNYGETAGELLDVVNDLPTKTLPSGKVVKVDSKGVSDEIVALANDALQMNDMTPRQYQKLRRDLSAVMNANTDNASIFGQAAALKHALELDLLEIQGPPGFAEAFRRLNKEFADYMILKHGTMGRRFSSAGTPGFEAVAGTKTINPDELGRRLFRSKSPQAMRELKQLVGRRQFRQFVASHIDDAASKAIKEQDGALVVDLNDFRRELGLGRPRSDEFLTLKSALAESETKLTAEVLGDWFDVAENVFGQQTLKTSQFIARRLTLGGPAAVLRSFAPTAGAAAGIGLGGGPAVAAAVFLWMGTRKFSNFLTDPRLVKLATKAMNPTVTPRQAEAAAIRFFRLAGSQLMQDTAEVRGDVQQQGQDVPQFTNLPGQGSAPNPLPNVATPTSLNDL